jgi:hypothetical protein
MPKLRPVTEDELRTLLNGSIALQQATAAIVRRLDSTGSSSELDNVAHKACIAMSVAEPYIALAKHMMTRASLIEFAGAREAEMKARSG